MNEPPPKKKNGRPRKPPAEKRDCFISYRPSGRGEVIKVRVTAAEKEIILAKAQEAEMSVSRYMDFCVRGKPIIVNKGYEFTPSTRMALKEVGDEINRIAKSLNSGRDVAPLAITAALMNFSKLAMILKSEISYWNKSKE